MSDKTVTWAADGGAVKPHQAVLEQVADEYRLQFNPEGIHTAVIDPANVLMAEATLDPGITGEYVPEPGIVPTFGMNGRLYKRAISEAKKGRGNDTGEKVEFSFDYERRRLETSHESEIGDHTIEYGSKFSTIDPDSMRRKPDVPNIDLPVETTIGRRAFTAALGRAETKTHKYLRIRTDEGSLIFEAEEDDGTGEDNVTIHGVVPEDGKNVSSLYSVDYISDIRKGLEAAKPESVRVKLGDDYPINIFAELPDVGLEFTYMLAPRIKSE